MVLFKKGFAELYAQRLKEKNVNILNIRQKVSILVPQNLLATQTVNNVHCF